MHLLLQTHKCRCLDVGESIYLMGIRAGMVVQKAEMTCFRCWASKRPAYLTMNETVGWGLRWG